MQNYEKEYIKIFDNYHNYQEYTKKEILNLMKSATYDLGEFFKSKNYIYDKKLGVYYNPESFVGAKFELPEIENMSLESDFNVIRITIGYRCNGKFFEYNHQCLFSYKTELPEKLFLRFKKYTGKTELERIKNYLKRFYLHDILVGERKEKLKKLSS